MRGSAASQPVTAADAEAGAAGPGAVAARLGPPVARPEPRRHAAYLRALLGDRERKDSRQAAGYAGLGDPHASRRPPGRAGRGAGAARDLPRGYAREDLAAPRGVPVIDEAGFPEQGDKPAGVQRRYRGGCRAR